MVLRVNKLQEKTNKKLDQPDMASTNNEDQGIDMTLVLVHAPFFRQFSRLFFFRSLFFFALTTPILDNLAHLILIELKERPIKK